MNLHDIYRTSFFGLLILLLFQSCQDKKPAIKVGSPATTNFKKQKNVPEEAVNIDSLVIFTANVMQNEGKNLIFISLSDIYHDAAAVPSDIIAERQKVSFEALQRIELPASHRRKLLNGTNLKETDTLFLYRYDANFLQRIPVKNLNAVAYLSAYTSEGEDISADYYLVGFELSTPQGNDNPDMLAYFGPKNPFAEEQLKPVKWTKISSSQFPENNLKINSDQQESGSYRYENGALIYYLQDYRSTQFSQQRILIVHDRNGKAVYQRSFDNNDEGAGLIPLQGIDHFEYVASQWTGNLFKGAPPVVTDFMSQSFGCEEIIFLNQSTAPLSINCDNRH